jgi:hypothetical protein
LKTPFTVREKQQTINSAITLLLRRAKEICWHFLFTLGDMQLLHYELLGDLADLDKSILNQKKVANFTQDDHLDKPKYLSSLGGTELMWYEQLGQSTNLVHAMLNLQKAVQSARDDHPKKQMYLSNLGISQLRQYEHLGQQIDLDDCISNLQKLVKVKTQICSCVLATLVSAS